MSREGSVPMGLVVKSPHDICSTKLWLKQPTPLTPRTLLPPEMAGLIKPFLGGDVARGGGGRLTSHEKNYSLRQLLGNTFPPSSAAAKLEMDEQ